MKPKQDTSPEDGFGMDAPLPSARETLIAESAYLRWVTRGCPHGSDMEDWLEAERDLERQPDPQTAAAQPQPRQ